MAWPLVEELFFAASLNEFPYLDVLDKLLPDFPVIDTEDSFTSRYIRTGSIEHFQINYVWLPFQLGQLIMYYSYTPKKVLPFAFF